MPSPGALTPRKSYLRVTAGAIRLSSGRRPRHHGSDGKVVGETKRRIEITVERRRLIVQSGRSVSGTAAWCAACGGRVRMLSPDEAALVAGITLRTIFRRVEGGQVHFTETAEGQLLICPNTTD
jgi:hypothetical protein